METTVKKGELVNYSIQLHREKQEKELDFYFKKIQEIKEEKDQLLTNLKELVFTQEDNEVGSTSLMIEGRNLEDECEEIDELLELVKFWDKELRVKETNQLLNQVNELVNKVYLHDKNIRFSIPHHNLTIQFLIKDFKSSILKWEREVDRDYKNYEFIQFCYQLINDIEFGRRIEIKDRFGNRYEIVGHLRNDYITQSKNLFIDYTIPKMKLEWLNKTYKFFQDRVDFWEELNPEEDDLSMFYPLQIDNPEDVNIPYQITRFYEQLRNSIKFKIDNIKKV